MCLCNYLPQWLLLQISQNFTNLQHFFINSFIKKIHSNASSQVLLKLHSCLKKNIFYRTNEIFSIHVSYLRQISQGKRKKGDGVLSSRQNRIMTFSWKHNLWTIINDFWNFMRVIPNNSDRWNMLLIHINMHTQPHIHIYVSIYNQRYKTAKQSPES